MSMVGWYPRFRLALVVRKATFLLYNSYSAGVGVWRMSASAFFMTVFARAFRLYRLRIGFWNRRRRNFAPLRTGCMAAVANRAVAGRFRIKRRKAERAVERVEVLIPGEVQLQAR